jgi:uncharacterized protein YndB with AHSA1/START domain
MQKIAIQVAVKADLEKVWKYWNEPEHIKSWAFASPDWECPSATKDIVENKKISYVMSDDLYDIEARRCEIIFKDIGDGTVLIIETFDTEDENPVEMQKSGWQSILNNFKRVIEASISK